MTGQIDTLKYNALFVSNICLICRIMLVVIVEVLRCVFHIRLQRMRLYDNTMCPNIDSHALETIGLFSVNNDGIKSNKTNYLEC